MERLNHELELAESSHSYKYQRCIRFLELLFGIFLIRVTPIESEQESKTDEEEHINSRVTVDILDRSHTNYSRSAWRWLPVRLLFFIFLMCLLVKFLIIAVLQISYERLVRKLMQQTCFIIDGTNCCMTTDTTDKKIQSYQMQLNLIVEWIDLIGYPTPFVPVIGPLIACLITGFMITAYPVSLIMFGVSNINLDIMGFVYNPAATARRLYKELDRISSDLYESSVNYIIERRCTCRSNVIHETPFCHTARRSSVATNLLEELYRDPEDPKNRSNLSGPIKLLRLLPQASRRIHPANLDVAWHKNLQELSYMGIRAFILFLSIFSVIFVLFYIFDCINWRYVHSIEMTKCSIYGKNVRAIDYINIKPLNLFSNSNDSWTVYRQNQEAVLDEQSGDNSFLLISSYFTFAKVWMIVEIGVCTTLCNIWCTFVICLFVTSVLDKVRWVKQIQNQLILVTEEQAKETVNHDKFLNLSVTAYLNYALFKSQYHRFRSIANMAMSQVLIFTAFSIFILYMINGNDFKTNYISGWCIKMTFVVLSSLSNGIFAAGSYLFAEVEHTIKQLTRVLTLYNNMSKPEDAETELSLEFIMTCWHKHLLDKDDLARTYALNLLGIKVCFEKLLPMNAYTLAVALMMVKN